MRSSVGRWVLGVVCVAGCGLTAGAQSQEDMAALLAKAKAAQAHLDDLKKAQVQANELLKQGPPKVDISNAHRGIPHAEIISEQINHVLTFDEAMRVITTMAEMTELEAAHPEEKLATTRVNPFMGDPKAAVEADFGAAPLHNAVLKQNGFQPFQFECVMFALMRAKPMAETARDPHVIANLCHSGGGGQCTVQQVMLVREHYAELKAQWERYPALTSGLQGFLPWTHAYEGKSADNSRAGGPS